MTVTRPLVPDDAAELAALVRAEQEHLAPWTPRRPALQTVEGQRAALAQQGAVLLGVVDDGALVGTVTLSSVIRGAFQSCSVGYWLAASAQGRGLATTAVREALDVAFGELRLHRVQAETQVRNERSQRVLRRLGFVEYGRASDYLFLDGAWRECVLFQLTTPTPERVVVDAPVGRV